MSSDDGSGKVANRQTVNSVVPFLHQRFISRVGWCCVTSTRLRQMSTGPNGHSGFDARGTVVCRLPIATQWEDRSRWFGCERRQGSTEMGIVLTVLYGEDEEATPCVVALSLE